MHFSLRLALLPLLLACHPADAAEPAAAQSDAASLLKEARAQHERLPPQMRELGKLPLAVAECQFGDRDAGRKLLAELSEFAKKQLDVSDRFGLLGQLIDAQRAAGLPDDARETIRTLQEAEKSATEIDLVLPLALIYGSSAIEFYAADGDDAAALAFISSIRVKKGVDPTKTEADRRHTHFSAHIGLVEALLRYDHKAQAERALRKLLTEYPDFGTSSSSIPQFWILLGKPDEARRALDSMLQTGDTLRKAAEAYITVGDKDEARKMLAKLQLLNDSDHRWDEFKVYVRLGEYDKAFEAANRPKKPTMRNAPPDNERLERSVAVSHLTRMAVLAARAGRQDIADRALNEVEKIVAAKQPGGVDGRPNDDAMQLGMARLMMGDSTALINVGDKTGDPMMIYLSRLITAAELHARKTGKKIDGFWPVPDYN